MFAIQFLLHRMDSFCGWFEYGKRLIHPIIIQRNFLIELFFSAWGKKPYNFKMLHHIAGDYLLNHPRNSIEKWSRNLKIKYWMLNIASAPFRDRSMFSWTNGYAFNGNLSEIANFLFFFPPFRNLKTCKGNSSLNVFVEIRETLLWNRAPAFGVKVSAKERKILLMTDI